MGVKIRAEIYCDGCGKTHAWESNKYRIGKCGMTDFVKEQYGWKQMKDKLYCRECYEKISSAKQHK